MHGPMKVKNLDVCYRKSVICNWPRSKCNVPEYHLSFLTVFPYWGMGIVIFIGIRWVGVPPPCLPREEIIVSKLLF